MSQTFMTLSTYETSAEDFFTKLIDAKIDLLVDVRLHNTNQLCGFTKERDLAYFVKTIVGAAYAHDVDLAPTTDLLEPYLHHHIDFDEYASGYKALIDSRGSLADFSTKYGQYQNIAILGTATHKRRSHAEVLAELLTEKPKATH